MRRADIAFAVVALGLGALLEATIAPRLSVLDARIDLVMLLVVTRAVQRDVDEAALWGVLGGAFLDLFSAAPFGTSILALGVAAVVIGWLSQPFRRSRLLAVVALAPVATVVCDLLLAIILQRLGWTIDYPATVALVVLPSCLVNAIAAPVVYGIVRLLEPRRRRASYASL